MRKMFRAQSTKLLVIKDTPQSIALGAAIGVLLGFTPLFGLKTLLTLLLAALFRVNKISAVVAVSLHDLLLPLWPVVLRLEFNIGYWLLHEPHQLPARLNLHHLDYRVWFNWHYFGAVGGPTLLGSVILGVPASVAVYALLKWVLVRSRQRQAEADDSVQ
jgi:uncharacterized protein (TIGR03546 family)